MNRMRSAECGVREGKGGFVPADDVALQFRVPHSAFRTWGLR